jgi:L-ascorbate metabolism protein UlaG (beta-lactamase superfamily)
MEAKYNGVRFERQGHATVRIESADGTVIYIDPWNEVIDDAPSDADIVLVTHDDSDHYDPEGIRAVSSDSTVVAAYDKIDTSDISMDLAPLPYNGETEVKGIKIKTVPAHNRSDGKHVRDTGEPYHAEGEVVGLVLLIDGHSIYFPSDTDFLDVHRQIDADVVLPPIGGSYTMDRHEAAEMVESIDPDLVLPVHYNTEAVPGVDTDADAFKEAVETRGIRVVLF